MTSNELKQLGTLNKKHKDLEKAICDFLNLLDQYEASGGVPAGCKAAVDAIKDEYERSNQ